MAEEGPDGFTGGMSAKKYMSITKTSRSLTNFVVKSKRKAKACATRTGRATRGSVDFLFGLTTNHGICQRTKKV